MLFHSEKSPAIFRWAMDPKKIRPVVTKHRVHLKESFQKFWSVFFFFNWVLFSIWFNLKLESTGNYESTFLFFFKYFSQDVCRFSGSRMAIYFIATQELSICTHARSIFTRTLSIARHILSIAASLQLGKKKKTAMAQWKKALFWFFLYALKSLNTGLGNCLNIRIIDVKDSLKFTLHKFYNPPSTTLHSCFFVLFWLFRIYHYSAEVLPCTTEVI